MLAIVLAVLMQSVACWFSGCWTTSAFAAIAKDCDYLLLKGKQKLFVLLLLLAMTSSPMLFTSLLLWYVLHKMV
jgi:hypothetical protein